MEQFQSYIDINGKLGIPIKLRKKLKLERGGKVTIKYQDDVLTISSISTALDHARAAIDKYIHPSAEHSLVDELIKMRKEDAEKE